MASGEMRAKIEAPSSYLEADEEERNAISNGCGPRSRFGVVGRMIPDSILGVDISEACSVHDWEYFHADDPRSLADARFHRNMTTLIEKRGGIFKALRHLVASAYYRAVRLHGGPSFGGKIK